MKRLAWLLLLASSAAFGQVPAVTQNNSPALDYLTVNLTTWAVTRFEIQFDTGAFVSIGLPTPTDDTKTGIGAHTYAGAKLGTYGLTVGSHTFAARACNAAGCGTASSPPFSFSYAPILDAPVNQRLQ